MNKVFGTIPKIIVKIKTSSFQGFAGLKLSCWRLRFFIIGQYSGKMLAETGSFDILLGNWVLGIGFFSYIHKYILGYIHVYTYIRIYMIENGRWRMMWYYMVSYHETTHGQDQSPTPICVIEYGWCRYALIRWYMVSHHETTHGQDQGPIPICVIEYGWWRYALIWWYMVGHHEITYGPSQGPIPICVIEYGLWRFALIWWYMVGHHETQAKTQYQNAWSSIDDRGI